MAHPVLKALYEVVAEIADAEAWMKLFQGVLQRGVVVLGGASAAGGGDDAVDPLADGRRAGQVVFVGLDDVAWGRGMAGLEHLVLQFHQLPDDAADTAVQQVVVGM